jgi:hypothetical protein
VGVASSTTGEDDTGRKVGTVGAVNFGMLAKSSVAFGAGTMGGLEASEGTGEAFCTASIWFASDVVIRSMSS